MAELQYILQALKLDITFTVVQRTYHTKNTSPDNLIDFTFVLQGHVIDTRAHLIGALPQS